jgi:hypothetical protein
MDAKSAGLSMLIAAVVNLPVSARAQPKEECDGKVMATIKMLEIRSMMKGSPQKHGDLSIADIERLQKIQGSCAAAKEIDKRTKGGAPVGMF